MVLLISQVRVYAQVSVLGRFGYTLGSQVWWRGQLRFAPRFRIFLYLEVAHGSPTAATAAAATPPTAAAAPLVIGAGYSNVGVRGRNSSCIHTVVGRHQELAIVHPAVVAERSPLAAANVDDER